MTHPTGGYFYYTTLTLFKKSRKEMASLAEKGQEINVHFSKVTGKSCKRPLRKTR